MLSKSKDIATWTWWNTMFNTDTLDACINKFNERYLTRVNKKDITRTISFLKEKILKTHKVLVKQMQVLPSENKL